MAEARAAVDNIRVVGSLQLEAIVQRAKLRGPQAHTCNGGIVIVLPPPSHLLRLVLHKAYNTYHHFQRACWPAPVWAVMAVLNVCIGYVMHSPQDSWLRSGPVAALLWDADERFLGALGVSSLLPAYLRIAYLAGYSALACMLIVALVSKLSMRLLLGYRGWIFEKKPSLFTGKFPLSLACLSLGAQYLGCKGQEVFSAYPHWPCAAVWGLSLRFFYLGQRSPLTYSFQNSMPRQPVPALALTLSRYLKTVKPLLSLEDYIVVEKEAAEFAQSAVVRKAQALLVLKSWLAGNHLSKVFYTVTLYSEYTRVLILEHLYQATMCQTGGRSTSTCALAHLCSSTPTTTAWATPTTCPRTCRQPAPQSSHTTLPTSKFSSSPSALRPRPCAASIYLLLLLLLLLVQLSLL